MATNVVRPGINENRDTTEERGRVKEIQKDWSVIEDGALAIKLQEEENTTHYSGNISRRRTVRSDIRTAKSAADEEALSAFREEHDIAEKNRQIEMEDAETAKKILHEMMEEEKRKIREQRQQQNEEADREAAKELYRQMVHDEKQKMRSQKSFEETDAELALRLQNHEQKKQRILSQRHHSLDHEMESERLARQLAREEKNSLPQPAHYEQVHEGRHRHGGKHEEKHSDPRYHTDRHRPTDLRERGHRQRPAEPREQQRPSGAGEHHKHRPTDHRYYKDNHSPEPREHKEMKQRPIDPKDLGDVQRQSEYKEHRDKQKRKDYLVPNLAGLRVAVDEEPLPELAPRKHRPQRMPRQHSAPAHPYPDYAHDDSDEETDVIAKIQDDEELARRLQREEIQKSRAPAQLTEKQRNQLIHDQKIAIKMQHEEVMFSKKSTYDNYMGKVRDEIADPEPMVHVSRQNKTAVHADAKYGDGVQLTDYTAAEGAHQRRTSGSGKPGAEGNILATIDPTFNRGDAGNVVLIKKTSLTEEPSPGGDGAVNPVQGSKRKESKDKGKRGSIFSKLKKK